MDLTTKKIKINEHFEVTLGAILFTGFITLFEILGILCFNNWIFTPSVFFIAANALFTLRKKAEDRYEDNKIEELEERIKMLEGKNELLDKI